LSMTDNSPTGLLTRQQPIHHYSPTFFFFLALPPTLTLFFLLYGTLSISTLGQLQSTEKRKAETRRRKILEADFRAIADRPAEKA
jgi:hypothetical protein